MLNDKKLVKDQYKTDKNLAARMNLHEKYGTSNASWFEWVFDFLPELDNLNILEVGCGNGRLWVENAENVKPGWDVVLSDYSSGMVQQSRSALISKGLDFQYAGLSVMDVPFPDECFDVVIADHMLYHSPDLEKAVSELARVLRSGGLIIAATNGKNHMREYYELIESLCDDVMVPGSRLSFSLENGKEKLEKHFREVTCFSFENDLRVTSVPDMIAYYLSSITREAGAIHLPEMEKTIDGIIQKHGYFFIHKSMGLYKGIKA